MLNPSFSRNPAADDSFKPNTLDWLLFCQEYYRSILDFMFQPHTIIKVQGERKVFLANAKLALDPTSLAFASHHLFASTKKYCKQPRLLSKANGSLLTGGKHY
jgi:hypothetical protein